MNKNTYYNKPAPAIVNAKPITKKDDLDDLDRWALAVDEKEVETAKKGKVKESPPVADGEYVVYVEKAEVKTAGTGNKFGDYWLRIQAGGDGKPSGEENRVVFGTKYLTQNSIKNFLGECSAIGILRPVAAYRGFLEDMVRHAAGKVIRIYYSSKIELYNGKEQVKHSVFFKEDVSAKFPVVYAGKVAASATDAREPGQDDDDESQPF